jgi:hypothetical protein
MNIDPWNYVTEFEKALSEYTGAPYVITTDCATHAMELCLRFLNPIHPVQVPTHTYLSVPMMVEKIGAKVAFINEPWEKYYQLNPYPVIDGSVHFTENCYIPGTFYCVSFQHKKRLNLGRGGAILLDNKEAYETLKMMRYDGRSMPSNWADDEVSMIGYHYYMTPEQAQKGLTDLKENNLKPYENKGHKDYPNLLKFPYFSRHDPNDKFHDGYHDFMYAWKPKEGILLEIFVSNDDHTCSIEKRYNILKDIPNGRLTPYLCGILYLLYQHEPELINEFQDDMYLFSINHNNYYSYANIRSLFPDLTSIKIFEIEVLWARDYPTGEPDQIAKTVSDWFIDNKDGNFLYKNLENINQFANNNKLDVTYYVCETGYENLNPEYLKSFNFKIENFNLFLISQVIDFRVLAMNKGFVSVILKAPSDMFSKKLKSISDKTKKKKILNLNRRPDWHRHLLAQTLLGQFEKNQERLKVTWLSQDIKSYNQHIMINGKSEYINFEKVFLPGLTEYERDCFNRGETILKNTDLRFDKDVRNNQFFFRYFDTIDLYEDIAFEIVSESTYFGPAGDVSEKSLRPLLLGVPFIIMGGANSFKILEKLGFKSFDSVVNYNSKEKNHLLRFRSIAKFTDDLAKLSNDDYATSIQDLTEKCNPVALHNQINFTSKVIINNIKKWIQEIHQ